MLSAHKDAHVRVCRCGRVDDRRGQTAKVDKGVTGHMSKSDFFKGLSRKAAAPQKQPLPEKKIDESETLSFYRRSQRNDNGGGNRPR